MKPTMKIHCVCYWFQPKIENPTQDKQTIEIISNFHTCDINGMKISVNEACGPDAVLHMLCHIDLKNVLNDKQSNNTLFSLIRAYNDGDKDQVYRYRALLLIEKAFKLKVISLTEIEINCDSNVFSTFQMLLSDHFASVISTRICDCGSTTKKTSIIEIDVELFIRNGFANHSECFLLKSRSRKNKCLKCNINQIINNEYSNLLSVDVQPVSGCERSMSLPKMTFNSIPSQIAVNQISYELVAIIEYKANLKHYIAHVNKNAEWIAYDDTSTQANKSNVNATIKPHLLVFKKN